MAVTPGGDGIDITVSASGAERTKSKLESLADKARSLVPNMLAASRAMGRAGEQADDAGDSARGASRAFGILSITSSGLSASVGILTTSLWGLTGVLGVLMLALTPLIPVLVTAGAALGGIAAAFGLIIGSGIVAWGKGFSKAMKKAGKQIKKLISKFGQKFVPLIKMAVKALPKFISLILDAVGNLQPFVKALKVLGSIAMRVIPKLIGVIFDLARVALPIFVDIAKWISKRIVPALKTLFQAGKKAAGPIYDFARALFRVGKSLKGTVRFIFRLGTALYNLAAAAMGVGKLNKALGRTARVLKQGLRGAFQWLKTTGVALARKAFRFLADAAIAAFNFGKKHLVPAVKNGIKAAWRWVKTSGVRLGRKALSLLARAALKAFEFGKKHIVPAVKSGIKAAWRWVKTSGVRLGQQALKTLARLAIKAFDFGKKHVVPAVKGAIGDAVNWLTTKGLSLFKKAFRTLGKKLGQALLLYLRTIPKAFKKIIPRVRTWLKNNGTRIIKQAFKYIGKAIRKLILGLFAIAGLIGQAIVSGIKGLADWLKSGGARKLKNAFVDIIKGIWHYLKTQAVSDLIGAIQFIIDGIIAAFKGLYQGLIGGSLIPKMFREIAQFIRTFPLVKALNKLLSAAFDRVYKFGQDIFNSIKHAFGDILSYIKTDLWGDLTSALGNLADAAVSTFTQAFNSLIPDSISIPSVTVGGYNLPDPIPDVPKVTIGGGSIDLPELAVGGTITDTGLFVGHAGETIVPAGVDTPYTGGDEGGGIDAKAIAAALRDVLAGAAIELETDDEAMAETARLVFERQQNKQNRAIDRARSSFGDI